MNRPERVVALVSGLGAAQGVAIVTQIGATGDAVGASPFGAGPTAQLVVAVLSSVFLVVAITVTAVVVSGAAEVVLTGRLREIALRRLLGASAADERRRAARDLLRPALLGMAVGAALGYAASVAVLESGLGSSAVLHVTAGDLAPSPLVVPALVAQLLATRLAVRRGTRGVLAVRPVEALRQSGDTDAAVRMTLAVPPRASAATLAAGVVLLGTALAASPRTPLAVLPAVAGGTLSFVGLVSYGHRVVPPVLAAVGRFLPRTLALTLARRSLLRHPVRSSRAVLGVAAAVTVVTTFAVGIAGFQRAVHEHYEGAPSAGLAADVLHAVVTVVLVLTAFLGVTAAVALGNAVSFGAWLRRRDTALLRVIGQSARGTRATVLGQSLLLSLTAVLLGLALGTAYGWIGAQCLFGVEADGHLVTPVLPLPVLAGTVAAAGVLTLAASVLPIRAGLRQAPIRAYLAR